MDIGARRDSGKHNSILQAAIQVIAGSGYHNAQISRIAREAGVADGTVYLYFKNKEDLLLSILRKAIGEVVSQLEEALARERDAASKLRRVVEVYFGDLGSDPALAMVTQVHLRQVDAELRRQVGDIMKPFYNLLDGVIDQGVYEGVFNRAVSHRVARRMIFGTMDETVTAWVLTGASTIWRRSPQISYAFYSMASQRGNR
ncbi:TetR/AcrR family transcriptional regulator [Alicyclobacillus fastidiosus]|uniref:TetR/AcrR family transcriptional regulator n=1 Tax=Alicyclobacillus fastidiosus TaxID=392011 RepID=UPI0023E951ED|nr:TetR/AcrR family transcriptional regulator [Alicyclobacillus fastidiosus]GMA62311.1 fatty acid metabolism regulator protein [Alicyclobacillus fastidiosus]